MAFGMSFLKPSLSPHPSHRCPRSPQHPDPSLISSQSDSSVPRLDHSSSHTAAQTPPADIPIPPSSTLPTFALHSSFMDAPAQDHSSVQYPSISPLPQQNGLAHPDADSPASSISSTPDVDPQILEALRSKDRIYVLKLGETFEALILERRTRVELTPATSYQRLLVHRCSAYYRLSPENDPVTKGIFVLSTADSRIPDRRISELIPAEFTAQPSFKIMRRSVQDRRSKPHSQAGSVAGEDGDLSDVEPSESGSLGGRSNVTSSSNKKRMTIEEREAAYNEARSRIFMDFEEKEKSKEKDMSASSSSLSLNGSASTSAGGRSSIGDTDDAASSPATESEWSAPSASNSRDRKDGRRGGPASGSASSNRSLRSGGSLYNSGSGGSSRNSRAPSPSFSYASIHDTSPGHVYDPSQQHHNQNIPYYPSPYYPYSPPGQGPSPAFIPPYYYPHYNPYQSPPIAQHTPSDPTTPSGPEPYSPPHPISYAPHYGWPPHPGQPPLQSPPPLSLPPQQPQQNPMHPMVPPLQLQPQSPHYQPFGHPSHAYSYPMNAYYPQTHLPPPPGGQLPLPPPHMNMPPQQQHQHQHQTQPQQQPGFEISRAVNGNQMGHTSPNDHFNTHNGNGPRNGLGNGVIAPNNNGNNRGNVRNGGGPGLMNNNGNGVNGGKHRAQMPPVGRSAWSYGPGVGSGGYTSNSNSAGGEAVGPRLHAHRHPSGNSSSGGNSRSSNCDDVSSTSSSTTSSSSRRTYTSTTSSQQHPLPARPDWAVGLKAQPTLAAMGGGRHHDHSLTNSRTMSPISPPRSNGHNSPLPHNNGSQQNGAPVSLQATDFPPLTSAAGNAAPEKRAPVVTGAWGQSRPILTPAVNGNATTAANPSSAQQSPVIKQEDGIKSSEPIVPKLARRPPAVNGQSQGHQRSHSGGKELASAKGDTVVAPVTALVGQVFAMSLEGGEDGGVDAASPSPSVPTTNNNTSTSAPSVVAPAPSV